MKKKKQKKKKTCTHFLIRRAEKAANTNRISFLKLYPDSKGFYTLRDIKCEARQHSAHCTY